MKKLLALLLAIVMVLSLAACGGDEDKNNGGNNEGANNQGGNNEGANNQGGNNEGGNNQGGESQAQDTYQAAIERLVKCSLMGDLEGLEKLAPEDFWKFYEQTGMPRKSMIDEAAYSCGVMNEAVKEQYGDKVTYTINITAKEDFDAAMMATIAACLKEQKGIPEDKFTAGCQVTADVSLKGNDEGVQTIETAVLQIDGQWYCASAMIWDEGAYVAFEIEMMIGG